jgi:hypothetical protein
MASHPSNGRGISPLPSPQQKAAFIAALLAPLPKDERGDVNEVAVGRQVREDRNRGWYHALSLLRGAYTALELAQHERLRWLHDDYDRHRRPPALIEAERACAQRAAEVVRIMSALVATPAQSRTQVLDKQKAYAAHTRGVLIDTKVRDQWQAALEAELARFPAQPRGKAVQHG